MPLARPQAALLLILILPLKLFPPPSFVMELQVGDIVHNKTTQEQGRIVRIADLPEYGFCYIVSVAPNPIWGVSAKEAIWKRSEVAITK